MFEAKYIDGTTAPHGEAETGWWAVDEAGALVLGPYPTREAALFHIAERFGVDQIASGG